MTATRTLPGNQDRRAGRTALLIALVLCLVAAGWTGASSALASSGSVWWKLNSGVLPSNFPQGTDGTIVLTAVNLGDASTSGVETITAVLPPGLKIKEVEGVPQVEFLALGWLQGKNSLGPTEFLAPNNFCEVAGNRVTCRYVEGPASEEPVFRPMLPPIAPYEDIELRVHVTNQSAVSGDAVKGEVSGGAAPTQTTEHKLDVGTGPAPFGVESDGFSLVPEEKGGTVDTQAGSHPYQLTTTFALNQTADENKPPALPRNLQFKLPPGLIGNASTFPRCSDVLFRTRITGVNANECPANAAVGVAVLNVDEPNQLRLATLPVPVFNLEPGYGEPARFGFEFAGSAVTLDTSVRTGADYGVTVSVSNITELTNLISSTVSFWGVPSDPSHNQSRGWACLAGGHGLNPEGIAACPPAEGAQPIPFLTLPTSCTTPFTTTVEGDSWPRRATPEAPLASVLLPPTSYSLQDPSGSPLSITGCNNLNFTPELSLQPEKLTASTPTGLNADLKFPIEETGSGLAPSALKATTVALPPGLQLNVAAADGLEACTEAQAGVNNDNEAACPAGSKQANVTVTSPDIPNPLTGGVYLASPQNFPDGPEENPFRSLLAAYLIAKDPISGVLVKLPGKGELNETTGQITLGFESPDLPFNDAKFEFFGGERAPIATPAHCGPYTAQATFTPYSGIAPLTTSPSFNITSGHGGGACPGPSLPFAPTLTAGTTSNTAATFSPLTTTISREDGEQFINSVTLHMPPGAGGVIAGIPRCAEAQANAGTCSPASLIGHSTASAGIGKAPFTVTGGQVYLTEGYKGAPFGLSIVTPAVAGPFNLGNVIVRARIDIDPTTAAITVTTDELPHILKGIPLEIKKVNVAVDRPNLTFNPTNCTPLTATGTIGAVEGATAPVSTRFQASGCGELPFKPTLTASVTGHNSKLKGAALTVKVTAKHGEANIHKVELQIPVSLPSRLTTLQKACTEAQFDKNPAGCPAGSFIGTAIGHTPVITAPLMGPAIIVSHGGAGFPDVEFLLQGEGVHITLDGKTDIKKGITYSRFQTVPDEPITSFETKLPQGPHSILSAFEKGKSPYNLCGHKLAIPTNITAQNGAIIHKSTTVAITGCHKAHKHHGTKKSRKAKKK